MTEQQIDKRKVTMKNANSEAVDYVRPDFLQAYVADAEGNGWTVTVSEEPDAGPGGYDGDTTIPPHLGVEDDYPGWLAQQADTETTTDGKTT